MTKTLKPRLTRADIRAIDDVLDMAIENSCSCGDLEFSDRDGFIGHSTDCYVHGHRATLRRVARIIDRFRDHTP